MTRTIEFAPYNGDKSPFNDDLRPVFGGYAHGNALFIVQTTNSLGESYWAGVVAGHCSTSGKTFAEACENTIRTAEKFSGEGRRVSFAHMRAHCSGEVPA